MEYKFRGKKKPNEPWFYGGFHKHETYTLSPVYAKGEEPPKPEYEYLIIESGFSDWNLPKPLQAQAVNPDSVGQYINRKDRNGTEIFTKDIIKVKLSAGYSDCYEWKLFEVIFDVKQLCFTLKPIGNVSPWFGVNALQYACEIEVVGNVFDNPEFLGVQDENKRHGSL